MILKIFDRFKVRKVEFFSKFQLSLAYDQFGSTFSFSFYFDPNNPDHKELACVSHYHDCVVEHNGEVLVSGFAISQGFTYNPEKQLATISGYSKPGLFEDVNIPPDIYPLQSDNLSLLEIARKLTSKWNLDTKYKIGVIVDASVANKVNKVFKKSTASETTTIAEYLRELAQQKQIIISHDEKGNLLFTQANTDQDPVLTFDFRNGMLPATSFSHTFNGQGMHSHITVMRQASVDGGNAGQITLKNPYVPTFYRPKTIVQSSGDDIDTNEVALREMAKEWENLTLQIGIDRWEVDGKIIKPNSMIEVFAPELYIYTKSRFFVRSIDYVGDEEKTTATLNCVIPEVVNGKMAKSIFEGINMHP
jgi:prophage tail gpP-like protein